MEIVQSVEPEKSKDDWLSRLHRMGFIFLIPIGAAALSDGDPMGAEEFKESFVGNTVVAELPEGTAFAYVSPDGTNVGLHPTEGRVSGQWTVDDEGVVCVSWPTLDIENCSEVIAGDEGTYAWGDRTLELQPGDPKGLSQ